MVEQLVEVSQVIREKEVVGIRRVGQPKTPPVWCDDSMVILQGITDELKRGRHIHPAMHHDQWRFVGRGRAPLQDVVTQVTDWDKFAARRLLD